MSAANCPSCGAPIEFAIGSSAVVVCGYCHTVVARSDRGLESHGVVAALIDTGSPLRVGTPGKYRGMGFRITGRTQMLHQAGGVWNEWYAAFDDGRWGWLAEAQGRFYVTFVVESDAPPVDELEVGRVVSIDQLTVAEIGRAQLVSAEGELPWTPQPGSYYAYADLTGDKQRFATIDYSEEPPVVFKGHEVTLAELGLAGEERRPGARVAVTKLSCSNCGGPLELRAPDQAERIWCPNCGAGHDVTAGKLQFFQLLKRPKVAPVIPLGAKGTVDGDEYVIAGFMQRAVRFDMLYYWTEHLLYNEARGFRWLVHSDDHWSFVTPLRPGEVIDSGGVAKSVRYDGNDYRLFQNATAAVTYVAGEFYWKVAAGEEVDTADYIRPPFGISKEVTRSGAKEIAYSHARYMTPREVEKAFGVERLPRPSTIGPMQPYSGARLGRAWLAMLALLVIIAVVIAIMQPHRIVKQQIFDLAAAPRTEGAPENGRVLFSEPFDLAGKYNVVVEGAANVQNSWIYVDGDLVNEATGALDSFELPIEFYEGYDQGEHWKEGDRAHRVYISRPEQGRHALRLEAQWELGKTPPMLHVTVREGVFRWLHFLLALIFISVFPVLAIFRKIAFESQRWKDSAFSPFGDFKISDDSDE